MEDSLDAALDALLGQPVSPSGPSVASDPVNQPMIRRWAAAFDDANDFPYATSAST